MQNRILIGIDPGAHTGVAVYEKDTKEFLCLHTQPFFGAIEMIKFWADSVVPASVIMEDPNGNRPVFGRGIDGRRASKIAQNVGMNKRDAQLMEEYCLRHDIPILKVRPTSKSMTKLSAEQFAKITGWTARSSEHARDAAMLVWGM